MEKKCYTCYYEDINVHDQPCCDCADYKYWTEKQASKDRHQLRDELFQMYIFGIECVGISYSEYEQMKKDFMIKLGEFEQKIQEECW